MYIHISLCTYFFFFLPKLMLIILNKLKNKCISLETIFFYNSIELIQVTTEIVL